MNLLLLAMDIFFLVLTNNTLVMGEKPVFVEPGDGSLPFSEAVRIGNILYLSGQIGFQSKSRLAHGFAKQFKAAMDRTQVILEENGSDFDCVIKATIMLRDMKNYKKMNLIISHFLRKTSC
eukprot:TRINITY_DN4493_c0_g1_i2.p1 TRINITY_DN4493_c0_g1~~TRINITY_DN4493_c0_g1_i2.p1  ORF type:complete len:121 (-),score=19.68 TRINITY_DN4493_c0_g1_i2:136-498(-)